MQLRVVPGKVKNRALLPVEESEDEEDGRALNAVNPAVVCPRPSGTGSYW